MKKTLILPVLPALIFGLLFLSSCTTPELDPALQLEAEEVAELVEASLQAQTGGLETDVETLWENIDSLNIDPTCDSLVSDVVSFGYQGPRIQASYNATWTFELGCNGWGNPESADFTNNSAGTYATQRISSDDSVSFQGSVADLHLIAPDFILNGTYLRVGSQEIDRQNGQMSVNSQLTVDLTNLTVHKYGQGIKSGLGTFFLSGDVSGNPFSHDGSIEFLGNKTATLTLNGTDYPLDWN